MDENKKYTEKDKKYSVILGVMLFVFVVFVGVCIAWGLGYIGINSNKENDTVNNQNTVGVYQEMDNKNDEDIVNETTEKNDESVNNEESMDDSEEKKDDKVSGNTTTNTNSNINTNNDSSDKKDTSSSNVTERDDVDLPSSDETDNDENIFNESSKELEEITNKLQNQILQSYNNKTMSGTQVRVAMMQYMTSDEITVVLVKGGNMVATVGAKKLPEESIAKKSGYYEITSSNYSAEGGTLHKTSIEDFNNVDSELYISGVEVYKSYLLVKQGTYETVGIVFVKQ